MYIIIVHARKLYRTTLWCMQCSNMIDKHCISTGAWCMASCTQKYFFVFRQRLFSSDADTDRNERFKPLWYIFIIHHDFMRWDSCGQGHNLDKQATCPRRPLVACPFSDRLVPVLPVLYKLLSELLCTLWGCVYMISGLKPTRVEICHVFTRGGLESSAKNSTSCFPTTRISFRKMVQQSTRRTFSTWVELFTCSFLLFSTRVDISTWVVM